MARSSRRPGAGPKYTGLAAVAQSALLALSSRVAAWHSPCGRLQRGIAVGRRQALLKCQQRECNLRLQAAPIESKPEAGSFE